MGWDLRIKGLNKEISTCDEEIDIDDCISDIRLNLKQTPPKIGSYLDISKLPKDIKYLKIYQTWA